MLPRHYLFLILLIAAFSAKAQKPVPPKGEPVIVNRDTLFKFYTSEGPFSPKERAALVNKRIADVISRLDFNPDSLLLKNDTAVSVITYKSALILALNNKDASFSELDRPQLAASYLGTLKKVSASVFKNYSFKTIAIDVAEALAEIAGLFLLIWAINRAFRWINSKSLRVWEARIAKLSQKKAPFGYAVHLLPILTNLIRAAKLVIIILLVYLALPVVFLILPGTKPIATELLSYIVNPLKRILLALVHYIPNLLTIAVICVVTRYIVKLFKFIAGEIENGDFAIKNFYPEWAVPTYNIIRILLYIFMFVVVFPYLPGSDSRVFQGVTLFFGVLFSFGSSSAISNAVAGIVLTYMRPFKIGDRVRIGEILGDVIEKNLLITRVRTSKNEDITVPNSTILSGATINYSSSSQNLGLILNTNITIGYDKPWQTVNDLLIEAALATEGIQTNPKPFVLQTALNEFSVSYQLNAYTSLPNKMSTLYSGLHKNIQEKFIAAGIEILSPHFTSFRDGNALVRKTESPEEK
jgi:small-conductance mechanosensitive channel